MPLRLNPGYEILIVYCVMISNMKPLQETTISALLSTLELIVQIAILFIEVETSWNICISEMQRPAHFFFRSCAANKLKRILRRLHCSHSLLINFNYFFTFPSPQTPDAAMLLAVAR